MVEELKLPHKYFERFRYFTSNIFYVALKKAKMSFPFVNIHVLTDLSSVLLNLLLFEISYSYSISLWNALNVYMLAIRPVYCDNYYKYFITDKDCHDIK